MPGDEAEKPALEMKVSGDVRSLVPRNPNIGEIGPDETLSQAFYMPVVITGLV
jgi:hypothetical protein